MDDTTIIIAPRSVILTAAQNLPQQCIDDGHRGLFNEILAKEKWTHGEAHFILSILKDNWHE